jgi:hypothetical protein
MNGNEDQATRTIIHHQDQSRLSDQAEFVQQNWGNQEWGDIVFSDESHSYAP